MAEEGLHLSLVLGLGVCINVLTGLVVDYCVLSKCCHACKLMDAKNLPPEELAAWKADHATDCCQNHSKSSKAMESEAAKTLWNCSIEKFWFRYVEMLSDGDSSAYHPVCESNPYPDYPHQIKRLDCINNAQKHMGTVMYVCMHIMFRVHQPTIE